MSAASAWRTASATASTGARTSRSIPAAATAAGSPPPGPKRSRPSYSGRLAPGVFYKPFANWPADYYRPASEADLSVTDTFYAAVGYPSGYPAPAYPADFAVEFDVDGERFPLESAGDAFVLPYATAFDMAVAVVPTDSVGAGSEGVSQTLSIPARAPDRGSDISTWTGGALSASVVSPDGDQSYRYVTPQDPNDASRGGFGAEALKPPRVWHTNGVPCFMEIGMKQYNGNSNDSYIRIAGAGGVAVVYLVDGTLFSNAFATTPTITSRTDGWYRVRIVFDGPYHSLWSFGVRRNGTSGSFMAAGKTFDLARFVIGVV